MRFMGFMGFMVAADVSSGTGGLAIGPESEAAGLVPVPVSHCGGL